MAEDFERVFPIWLYIEKIVCAVWLIGTEGDATVVPRDHGHLHFINEVTKVGGFRDTAMEKLLFGLGDVKICSSELTGSIVVIRTLIPVVAFVVVCQWVVDRQCPLMGVGVCHSYGSGRGRDTYSGGSQANCAGRCSLGGCS